MDELLSVLNQLGLGDNFKIEMSKKEIEVLLKDKILYGETCHAWFQNRKHILEDDLKTMLDIYSPRFEIPVPDCSSVPGPGPLDNPEENETDLKYTATEVLSKCCILVYINIVLKRYEKVPAIISEACQLIQHCTDHQYFSHEYADGFRNVVLTLEIFSVLANRESDVNGEENGDEEEKRLILQKILDDFKDFDDLSEKNQVGILGLKQYFIRNISQGRDSDSNSYHEQLEILKEVTKMDPQNSEWHCCLYDISRVYRKSLDNKEPSEQEKVSVQEAVKGKDAEFNPGVLIRQITCLAEILNNKILINGYDTGAGTGTGIEDFPEEFAFGSNIFSSNVDVVSFLKAEADKIFAIDPMSLRLNLSIAEIFTSILPLQIQDENFARICIKRALIFHPNSSEANYRMALFYLSDRDLSKALKHTKKAYEGDKHNMEALMDLIRLYMENITKNEAELSCIFDDVLANNSDSDSESGNYHTCSPHTAHNIVSELLFTKAIYVFLSGKTKETIDFIVQAYTIDEKATAYFKDIDSYVKRYHWYKNTRGKNILCVIQQLLFSAHRQCADNSRKSKLFKLHEAARVTEYNSSQGQGLKGSGESTTRDRSGSGSAGSGSGAGSRGGRGRVSTGSGSRGTARTGGGLVKNTASGKNFQSAEGKKDRIVQSNKMSPKSLEGYDVLGIPKTASTTEIANAYYKLVKDNYPDKSVHLTDETERLKIQEDMKRINKAWESLQI